MATVTVQDHRRQGRRLRSSSTPTCSASSPTCRSCTRSSPRSSPPVAAGTQSTKTRAEVSGGGKKPFKQKGTGNARQGSIRAPHFSGGGVALGPKPRKYDQKTPKKMIKLALRSALQRPRRRGQGRRRRRVGLRSPEDQGGQGRARRARHRRQGARRGRPRRHQHHQAASSTCREVQLIERRELNAYDMLVQRLRRVQPGHAARHVGGRCGRRPPPRRPLPRRPLPARGRSPPPPTSTARRGTEGRPAKKAAAIKGKAGLPRARTVLDRRRRVEAACR